MPEDNQEQSVEEVLKATSWWQGFLDGRNEGYRVGLTLGTHAALMMLEALVEKTKQGTPEENLAKECDELERKLSELGFVRKLETRRRVRG